jgi:glutamate dehydrogenase/leucine dehydrogenase
MKKLLEQFENKRPEIVFEWKDAETEAEGWVVINSLRGGAAGGGTRMRVGLDKREVESLAKTMEIKFTISGPQIGGAKSGINFDPNDPRKTEVLKRWYKAVFPLLKNYYGTGGDLNVDEIHEVIPITESYGLWHPQEGVVNGHYNPQKNEKIQKVGQLRMGVSKVIEDIQYTPDISRKYRVADMITGYGVAESVKHYYTIYGGQIEGKRVLVQGWGNVGSAAAFYLSQYGAKIVGIIDKNDCILKQEGLSHEEVKTLFLDKKGNTLQSKLSKPTSEIIDKIWDVEAEVFLPCAASRLVQKNQIERLISKNLEVVACGANVPFADKEIFFGPIAEFTDSKISLIPDFISNCGMARVFGFLMDKNIEITDDAIFSDTSEIIKKALLNCHRVSSKKINITQTAFEISLKKLLP